MTMSVHEAEKKRMLESKGVIYRNDGKTLKEYFTNPEGYVNGMYDQYILDGVYTELCKMCTKRIRPTKTHIFYESCDKRQNEEEIKGYSGCPYFEYDEYYC